MGRDCLEVRKESKQMFDVTIQTFNNPLEPDEIKSTNIILKQTNPFVQMSYKYEGDLTDLTDEEAIEKVLEDFYVEHYKNKIQEGKIAELELEMAKLKEENEQKLNEISNQNMLMQQSLFEIVELLLADETEDEADASDDNADGTSHTE